MTCHVIPLDDAHVHIESVHCECAPTLELIVSNDGESINDMFTHHSYDRREKMERATGKPTSKKWVTVTLQ